jgi:hypothetical protein
MLAASTISRSDAALACKNLFCALTEAESAVR